MPDEDFAKSPMGWDMVRLMWMAQHAIFSAASEDLHLLGLNPKSLAVLGIVGELPHPNDIAVSLGAPPPTISNILKELERLGYVERALDAENRRRTIVLRTAPGDQALQDAIAAVNRRSEPLFEPLSSAELAEFTRMLLRLTASLG